MAGPTNKDDDGRESRETDESVRLAALYEKMSAMLRESVGRVSMLTEDAFDRALQETMNQALKFKENHKDEITKAAEFMRRDWQEGMRSTGERARKTLDPDRLHAGLLGLLFQVARSVGGWLEQWAGQLRERLTYSAGEIAGAGTLACNRCGEQLKFERPASIPPCPKCGGNAFTRSY